VITVERVAHSGAYVVSALVKERAGEGEWYHRETYYGYPLREIRRRYRESLAAKGYTIVKD
jgi:hypothetical protein